MSANHLEDIAGSAAAAATAATSNGLLVADSGATTLTQLRCGVTRMLNNTIYTHIHVMYTARLCVARTSLQNHHYHYWAATTAATTTTLPPPRLPLLLLLLLHSGV